MTGLPGSPRLGSYAAGLTSFVAGFFRAGELAGIPVVKSL